MNDKYLLREGHLLGFAMGIMLSQWWYLAFLWVLFVGVMYIRSLLEKREDETLEKKYRTLRITYKEMVETSRTPVLLLIEQGFDLERPFYYEDDPLTEVRTYKQEIIDGTNETPEGRNQTPGKR